MNNASNKNVLILNLTSDDENKLRDRKERFTDYFISIGANKVDFIEIDTSKEEFVTKFEEAGLLYVPGGDTIILIRYIKEMNLLSHIKSFKGVYLGNSAGAYAMCPDYLRIGHGPIEIIPSFGLVNFWVKAHYKPEFESDLNELSKNREIFALEDESALIFDGSKEFLGTVWKFSQGKKEKVN